MPTLLTAASFLSRRRKPGSIRIDCFNNDGNGDLLTKWTTNATQEFRSPIHLRTFQLKLWSFAFTRRSGLGYTFDELFHSPAPSGGGSCVVCSQGDSKSDHRQKDDDEMFFKYASPPHPEMARIAGLPFRQLVCQTQKDWVYTAEECACLVEDFKLYVCSFSTFIDVPVSAIEALRLGKNPLGSKLTVDPECVLLTAPILPTTELDAKHRLMYEYLAFGHACYVGSQNGVVKTTRVV